MLRHKRTRIDKTWSSFGDLLLKPNSPTIKPEPELSDEDSGDSSSTLSFPERKSLIVRLPITSLRTEGHDPRTDNIMSISSVMSNNNTPTPPTDRTPASVPPQTIASYGALSIPTIGATLGHEGGTLTANEKVIKLLELKFHKHQNRETRIIRQMNHRRDQGEDTGPEEDELSRLREKMAKVQKQWLVLQPVLEDEDDSDYETEDEDEDDSDDEMEDEEDDQEEFVQVSVCRTCGN